MTRSSRPAMPTPAAPDDTRHFDGVICFGGEDWWYHNRGHFDMRIMRELRSRMPVLYVNSIGMRTPKLGEGRMFLKRVHRKLKSFRRGFTKIDHNFSVFSPLVAPSGVGRALTMPLLPAQVRLAARRAGIRRPLVWVNCPTAAEVVDALNPVTVVYQRTDRYEYFEGVDYGRIVDCDRFMKARADLTVFCSSLLLSEESSDCREACFVDHGVDAADFVTAGIDDQVPEDIAHIPGPRVGFVGSIDRHTFDPTLFIETARRLPHVSFVLVGGCSLSHDWCSLENVTLVGRKPLSDVPSYMAACDVLIMPWRDSPWIEACNPIKLKEYLATGRPVVSAPFHELGRYGDAVAIASTPEEFAGAIDDAIADPGSSRRRQNLVITDSWTTRANEVLDRLRAQHIMSPSMHEQLVEVKPLIEAAVVREPLEGTRHSGTRPITSARRKTLRQTLRPRRVRAVRPVHPCSTSIDACIMLAGGLKPSPLVEAADCSVLDLWLTQRQTVLDVWMDRLAAVPATQDRGVPMHILTSPQVPVPWPDHVDPELVSIEQEPRPLRGPAGVVADVCRRFNPDDTILIAEAARCLTVDLTSMMATHEAEQAAITVACNPDLSAAGVYLVRSGVFDAVPGVGFMDLKEQFLNKALDEGLRVVAHPFAGDGCMRLHTSEQFLSASLALREGVPGRRSNRRRTSGLVPSNRRKTGSVICPGAFIGHGATVVDSIVMPGAVVEDGAVVVRSLICPGSLIQTGTDIADAIAGARYRMSDRSRRAA